MTTTELKNAIGDSKNATVTFTKKNGEHRVMKCTRNMDYLENELKKPTPTGTLKYDPDDKGVVIVWDLEKDAWRSITADAVISVEA